MSKPLGMHACAHLQLVFEVLQAANDLRIKVLHAVQPAHRLPTNLSVEATECPSTYLFWPKAQATMHRKQLQP